MLLPEPTNQPSNLDWRVCTWYERMLRLNQLSTGTVINGALCGLLVAQPALTQSRAAFVYTANMSQSVQNSKKCFKEIYKFFYDYLKLYKLASSSRVSCWKQTDLRNALSWSSACEELTSKLAEKIQFYDVLLGEIDAILNYLHIECPKNQVVKKLIEEASIEMERVRCAHRSFYLNHGSL